MVCSCNSTFEIESVSRRLDRLHGPSEDLSKLMENSGFLVWAYIPSSGCASPQWQGLLFEDHWTRKSWLLVRFKSIYFVVGPELSTFCAPPSKR